MFLPDTVDHLFARFSNQFTYLFKVLAGINNATQTWGDCPCVVHPICGGGGGCIALCTHQQQHTQKVISSRRRSMAPFKRHIGSAGCESPGEPQARLPGVLRLTHHKSPFTPRRGCVGGDFQCKVSIQHFLGAQTCQKTLWHCHRAGSCT